jgi:hypothetical protein
MCNYFIHPCSQTHRGSRPCLPEAVSLALRRSESFTPSATSVKNTQKLNSTATSLQGVLLKLSGGELFTFQKFCIQGKQWLIKTPVKHYSRIGANLCATDTKGRWLTRHRTSSSSTNSLHRSWFFALHITINMQQQSVVAKTEWR